MSRLVHCLVHALLRPPRSAESDPISGGLSSRLNSVDERRVPDGQPSSTRPSTRSHARIQLCLAVNLAVHARGDIENDNWTDVRISDGQLRDHVRQLRAWTGIVRM